MNTPLLQNLHTIQNRIKNACVHTGRHTQEVRLLLATKTVSSDKIGIAMLEGETLMGENKVQELKQKCSAIAHWNPEVHFIGHLQTNKIKEVLKWVSCIQSIDRISLAQKITTKTCF